MKKLGKSSERQRPMLESKNSGNWVCTTQKDRAIFTERIMKVQKSTIAKKATYEAR
jgi:hypothetical protein